MRKQNALVGTLILAGSAAIAVSVLLPAPGVIPAQARQVISPVSGGRPIVTPDVFFPPLPPVPQPPNLIALAPIEQLGKNIIFDNTLSFPSGYACFQCHAPTTGGTSAMPMTARGSLAARPAVTAEVSSG